jgi:hypothetical protein
MGRGGWGGEEHELQPGRQRAGHLRKRRDRHTLGRPVRKANRRAADRPPKPGSGGFRSTGETLATAFYDGTVLLWDVDPASWPQARLCCRRPRFPRIVPATWANDAPLETAANRSAPMGCGPNVDQARPARRRQRRTASRPCRRKADPASCPRQATPPGNRLGRGALAGSGPGTSPCIDGCPWSSPWGTPASCLCKPCARRRLPGYARHQADHRPGLRRVARSDGRGTIVPKRAVEPERSRPRPPLRRCRC